jgi:hypothetical protein
LWNWFEFRLGIEAVGHMGPATWCYGTTFAFIVLGGILVGKAQRASATRRIRP